MSHCKNCDLELHFTVAVPEHLQHCPRCNLRQDCGPMTAQQLLLAVCAAAGFNAECAATAAGLIPADVRRAGWNAERYERYLHHYGQAPDATMMSNLNARLRYLTTQPLPVS